MIEVLTKWMQSREWYISYKHTTISREKRTERKLSRVVQFIFFFASCVHLLLLVLSVRVLLLGLEHGHALPWRATRPLSTHSRNSRLLAVELGLGWSWLTAAFRRDFLSKIYLWECPTLQWAHSSRRNWARESMSARADKRHRVTVVTSACWFG